MSALHKLIIGPFCILIPVADKENLSPPDLWISTPRLLSGKSTCRVNIVYCSCFQVLSDGIWVYVRLTQVHHWINVDWRNLLSKEYVRLANNGREFWKTGMMRGERSFFPPVTYVEPLVLPVRIPVYNHHIFEWMSLITKRILPIFVNDEQHQYIKYYFNFDDTSYMLDNSLFPTTIHTMALCYGRSLTILELIFKKSKDTHPTEEVYDCTLGHIYVSND